MARPKKQVKLKEPIKIRLKSLADGNKSIYLDIYYKGVRKYEYLKLYLVPEINPVCKEQNKQTMAIAERIKAERIKALHGHGIQDWETVKQGSMLLTTWIKKYCEGGVGIKKSTLHCRVEMLHTVEKYLDETNKGFIALEEVNAEFCRGYVKFLRNFPNSFPYECPDIFYFDTKYDYFPHIDYTYRRLCYLEEGITYSPDQPISVLRECIRQAKRLIEKGAKRENEDDFIKEIYSYWIGTYPNEQTINDDWLIYGDIPTTSQILKVWSYKETLYTEKGASHNLIIQNDDIDIDFEHYLKRKPYFSENETLFLRSVEIPYTPPYSISPLTFLEWIKDPDDKKLFKKVLNKKKKVIVTFPLLHTKYLGGCYIPLQPAFRKGHRNLTAFEELTLFEKKNRCLQRLIGKIYSSDRIDQRTSGRKLGTRKFAVIGLGSIGSNLCYFLSGWSNTEYILVDNDIMQPENIGRHLHGMKYIQQSKVHSVEEFLREKRPDSLIKSYGNSIENVIEKDLNEFNRCSALFMCVGDCMSEQYVLSLVKKGILRTPIFILWLEPFAIAGHLVYINPANSPNLDNILEKDTMLYKHNIIPSSEYISRGETEFISRDAGCNGAYAHYSGNDVILFLSAIYPIINNLIKEPFNSMCYRWVGNLNIAIEKKIKLIEGEHISGSITKIPL